MTNKTPSDYFARAKALQEMILNAHEDLKQLRADALEELGVDDMPKEQAKEIRKDLAEVFAVAKIEAKGELERRNQAAKMARRKRIAEECGVQLDLLGDTDAGAAQRMARASSMSKAVKGIMQTIAGGGTLEISTGNRGVRVTSDGNGCVATVEKTGPGEYRIDLKKDVPPHNPETGEVLDDDEPQRAATSEEPAVMHAGGMSAADYKALGEIPEFLRR
jgi:hypothetical protein